jgi:hypothetical protein
MAVLGVALIAMVVSYEHASAVVRTHGETGWTSCLIPLTVDGLIYASSMVVLDCARRKMPLPALAKWLLGLGIAATLAANVAHGLGHGLLGAAVAAWSAVALVGSYELLMMMIRSAQVPAGTSAASEASNGVPDDGPQHRLWRRSLVKWRPGGCPRFARSAPGCILGSRERNECARTLPPAPLGR